MRSVEVNQRKFQSESTHAALDYARLGWPIVPCYGINELGECTCGGKPGCKPGKHPHIKNWRNRATTDEAIIREWLKQWPNANIGILTGKKSGIIVIDIDPRNGGDDGLESLIKQFGLLSDTPEVFTGGGGRHLYFTHPGRHIPSIDELAPGVEVKADGGHQLVIAPPSRHVSGRRYEWEASSHPDDIPLAILPTTWLEEIKNYGQPTVSASPKTLLKDSIDEGIRDNTLFKLACSLRGNGAAEHVILATLQSVNAQLCNPPLTNDDLQRIAGSAAKYTPNSYEVVYTNQTNALHIETQTAAELPTPPNGKQRNQGGNDDTVQSTPDSEVIKIQEEEFDDASHNNVEKNHFIKVVDGFGHIYTAAEIGNYQWPEIQYAIPDIVPEGLTLLVASKSVGKSFLALGWSLGIASGNKVMEHIDVEQGDVFYIALEDSGSGMNNRLQQLLSERGTLPDRLHIAFECPRLHEKLLDYIENWLTVYSQTRLVVIDVLAHIRTPKGMTNNAYDYDYREMAAIQKIGLKHHVGILVLHHTNKGDHKDFVDTISGTRGISGPADAAIVLKRKRGGNEGTLEITGRLIPENTFRLNWDTGLWTLKNSSDAPDIGAEMRKAHQALSTAEHPMRITELAAKIGKTQGATKKLLQRMQTKNLAQKVEEGFIAL